MFIFVHHSTQEIRIEYCISDMLTAFPEHERGIQRSLCLSASFYLRCCLLLFFAQARVGARATERRRRAAAALPLRGRRSRERRLAADAAD